MTTTTILFKKPERKLDSFIVPIRGNGNNKIRIKLVDEITLQKILKVRDQDAHVIQCMIKDPEVQEKFKQYDHSVLLHVLENCNGWFGTDLSEKKIHEMFIPSLGDNMELRSLVSSIIEPETILNNTTVNGFCELLPVMESSKDLSSLRIILEIEAQGIYIRSKKFGIRWIIKYIRVIQEDIHNCDNAFDICIRMDINDKLKDDVNELEGLVQTEIAELNQKIRNLEEFVEKVQNTLLKIERVGIAEGKEAEQEWASQTDNLAKMIWNYQRNRFT